MGAVRAGRSIVLSVALLLTAVTPGGAQSPDPSAGPIPPTFFPIAPGVSVTPTGLDWQPVAPDPAVTVTRSTQAHDLITWRGGFAVAVDQEDGTLVRTSPDGLTWTTARLPSRIGWPRLVAFRDGLALLRQGGSGGVPGASFRFEVWSSPDGEAWSHAGGVKVVPPPGCLAGVSHLLATDAGLVAVGDMCVPPCCGVGAGSALALLRDRSPASRQEPRRMVAWSSPDGRSWTREKMRLVSEDGGRELIPSLVAIGGGSAGLLGVLEYEPRAVLGSADGVTWSVVAPVPAGYVPWGDNEAMVISGDGLLLVGSDDQVAGLWRSDGAGGWTRVVSSVEETETRGLAADAGWVLVSGVVRESYGDDRAFGWTLVSRDGGRTFDPSLGWTGPAGSCVREVAIHDGIAVMTDCAPGEPLLWRGLLP